MPGIDILFLSKEDVDNLTLDLLEVMGAIELGLKAHGECQVIMPSKDHLALDYPHKLFNILKGYVEPVDVAGVKVIGDFHANYEHILPSELALITLYRPETGALFAIVDGTLITWMRTGAVTAVGAKYLAAKDPPVLGHIGARGTAWYTCRCWTKSSILRRFASRVNARYRESALRRRWQNSWASLCA